jgi:hypothetical protein
MAGQTERLKRAVAAKVFDAPWTPRRCSRGSSWLFRCFGVACRGKIANGNGESDRTKEIVMIELTEQQVHALEQAQTTPPRLVNPKTQQRFVLVPEEQYAELAAYDSSPWSDDERDVLRAEALDALGWEGMEPYQDDQR